MPEAIYRLEKVTRGYDSREVCHIDFLEIFRGEILGIMGPNGSGKSTLLRLLNFLEPPSSGTIFFGGNEVKAEKRLPLHLSRKVTMVFQDPLMLNTSVAGNVAYGLKLRREKDIPRTVRTVLEKVGLTAYARARPDTLSGGEAQRAALARAMVIRPEVLLLDEPTANLDPYNVALVEDMVKEINREQGTTIVLVTHNVFQAKRVAHRVVFMLEGKAVEVGRTGEVFRQPHDPRTAAFIRGEMVY